MARFWIHNRKRHELAKHRRREPPFYLPQAKSYNGSTGLGPCLCLLDTPIPAETKIRLSIERNGLTAFKGETQLSQMKRKPEELAAYLFRKWIFHMDVI